MYEKKKYNLLLINPKQKYKHYATQYEMGKLLGKSNVMSPLSLAIIAAYTPENYNIKIVDEELEILSYDKLPDIVGITTLAISIERAYEIADFYKSKGIPVILGGPYATYMPQEALLHANSIVVGEAEMLWEQCLIDFESKALKPLYQNFVSINFKTIKIPRWDLINTKKILSIGVQVTRGCPYKCEFCLVSKMFGNKMRFREISNVVEEIKSLPVKKVFFVDDNLTINKKYAHNLMQEIKNLGITWTCQSSIDIGFEEELLKEMEEAGCQNILIGFETLNPSSLEEANKHHNNIQNYSKAIDNIHKAGIQVYSSFVVGFDHDTLNDFDIIYNFADENNLPLAMISLLGASPGTELYARLNSENRWYGSPLEWRGGVFPVMHYKNFSQKELVEKFYLTLDKVYNYKSLRKRSLALFSKGYFTRQGMSNDTTFFFKMKTFLLILKIFLLSLDREKRMLFIDLFRLFRNKQLAVDKFVVFLLTAEGIIKHIRKLKIIKDKLMPDIEKYDSLKQLS